MQPLTQNRYLYTRDNPVNAVDPTGAFSGFDGGTGDAGVEGVGDNTWKLLNWPSMTLPAPARFAGRDCGGVISTECVIESDPIVIFASQIGAVYTANAIQAMEDDTDTTSPQSTYRAYFGTDGNNGWRRRKVRQALQGALGLLVQPEKVTFYYVNNAKKWCWRSDAIACAKPGGSANTVLLMPEFYHLTPGKMFGSMVPQANTIIHELVHLALGSGDEPNEWYGPERTQRLACDDPTHAVGNADNYTWYILDMALPSTHAYHYALGKCHA